MLGVGLVSTEGLNCEAVKVYLFTQYTSGIAVSLVTLRYFFYEAACIAICSVCTCGWRQMIIQGFWCYTKEVWATLIHSGEPAVPGIIPGGVVRGLIPGRSGSTLSGVPTVPGKIPGGITSRLTPARQLSGIVSSIFLVYTRVGHLLVYKRSWILFTPMASWR